MGVDGINAIAVIAIASFAIDRVVSGLLFLLSFNKQWVIMFPDPELVTGTPEAIKRAQKKQKLLYFTVAGVLAIVVLSYFGNVRILHYLGFELNPKLDILLTGLILMGASDRVSDLLKGMTGGGEGPKAVQQESHPVEIRGTLLLEDSRTGRATPVDVTGISTY